MLKKRRVPPDGESVDGPLREFNDWMNGAGPQVLILSVLAAAILAPLLVLIHELGHATVGLARTEGLVTVRVGRSPARWQARFGRLCVEFNPLPARNAPAGLAAVYARYGTVTNVLYALAGPVAEAAVAAIVLWLGLRSHVAVLELVGGLGLVVAALNLVPHERHGFRSDGAYVLDALRQANVQSQAASAGSSAEPFSDAVTDTFARWLVLFSDERSAVRTKRRAQFLGGAAVGLGYRADDRGDAALAVWRLAFAGWCWREVERGDFSRVREAALDALHAATMTGAFEPNLTVLAARNLVTSSTDVGLGSPGTSDIEQTRFLGAAFTGLPPELRPPTIPVEQQRFAFRYGVALRDIERIRE
jgi:hypothetical protein